MIGTSYGCARSRPVLVRRVVSRGARAYNAAPFGGKRALERTAPQDGSNDQVGGQGHQGSDEEGRDQEGDGHQDRLLGQEDGRQGGRTQEDGQGEGGAGQEGG